VSDISNQNDQLPRVVTRMEIIDALGTAFGRNGATRQDILAAATQEKCRGEVLTTLQRIPERTYGHVRDLWDHLPDVPIGD
jgi:hypothetical protein